MPCGGDLHRPERVILFFFRRGNNEIDAHELQMISAQEHLHELNSKVCDHDKIMAEFQMCMWS